MNSTLSSMHTCPLHHWSVIEVSGKDVSGFLQGQITGDIKQLSASQGVWAAHCNAKGRAVANFIVLSWADKILMALPKSLTTPLTASLRKYGIFNQITITPAPFQLYGILNASPNAPWQNLHLLAPESTPFATQSSPLGFTVRFSEHAILAARAIPDSETHHPAQFCIGDWLPDEQTWNLSLIDAELAFITEATSAAFIPIELNMDLNQGISFSKGCYLGQEIIARLHYKSSPKQRLATVILPENCPTLTAGDDVFETAEATSPVGKIINVVQQHDGTGKASIVVRLSAVTNGILTIGATRSIINNTKTISNAILTCASAPFP